MVDLITLALGMGAAIAVIIAIFWLIGHRQEETVEQHRTRVEEESGIVTPARAKGGFDNAYQREIMIVVVGMLSVFLTLFITVIAVVLNRIAIFAAIGAIALVFVSVMAAGGFMYFASLKEATQTDWLYLIVTPLTGPEFEDYFRIRRYENILVDKLLERAPNIRQRFEAAFHRPLQRPGAEAVQPLGQTPAIGALPPSASGMSQITLAGQPVDQTAPPPQPSMLNRGPPNPDDQAPDDDGGAR